MGEFTEFSKEIVKGFLHNVILADDRIEYLSDALPSVINTPNRETVADDTPVVDVKTSEKAVNVKPILDEFFANGIPCSFLLLSETEVPSRYTKIFHKADAIILDWQVRSDSGEYMLELLSDLFKEEINTLRVILIYTGESRLQDIIQKIVAKFSHIPFVVDESHGCSAKYNSTIISAYAKGGISVDEKLSSRVVNEKQLVESLLNEFTNITLGLVSNIAIKAISIIRQNTHKLLSVFNKDLDPAFLAHRSLLANTHESEEQIIDIIGSEIKSLFYCDDATSVISKDKIKSYITDFFPETDIKFIFPFKEGFKEIQIPETIDRNTLIKYIEGGLESSIYKKDTATNDKKLFSSNCHTLHTEQFCHNNIDATKSNIKYALLTSTKTRFNIKYLPSLTLGTILKFQKDHVDYYYLCIQPKCDNVRIEKNREFLFLSLKLNEKHKDFDIIVDYNSDTLYFDIDYTIYKAKFFSFKANQHKLIQSTFLNDKIQFVGTTNMEWISELKNDFAQRISNTFASNLSRVGTNHSEWFRRGG